MTIATCPEPNDLQALMDGTLSAERSDELTEHLGKCSTCQEALQMLATGEIPLVSLLQESMESLPQKDSSYWKVAARISSEFDAIGTSTLAAGQNQQSAANVDLSFLKPSDDPAYLGRLNHFEISRVIGSGGMGVVLEAFDTHLHRTVAIKVLKPDVSQNDVARQRFCREGRAAAAISHEHVVPMYQVAKEDAGEVAYLVMEYVEGTTLEKMMNTELPIPIEDAARIGMQIAAGLSAAHKRGMVHRDVKPANILIDAETNRVKLTDFGLARASDEVRLTATGMVTGTPLYMSPEQAMGSTADECSDLFSLGAVMYEMATGASPFQAPTIVGVMKRIMDEDPPALQTLNPNVPKSLGDIIMALLQKDPEKRPESAASVAAALASVVTGFGPISPLQVPAVADSEVKKISGSHARSQRRFLTGAWTAAVISGISAVIVVAMLVSNVFFPGTSTGDNFPEWPVVVLPDNPGSVWSVSFSPDNSKLVAGIEDGTVRVWDIENKTVLKSFNAHRGVVWNVQYHPDESMVASSGDDGFLRLWNSESFDLIREWQAENAVRGIAFSPDGKKIAAGDRQGGIHIYDVESGDELNSQTQPGAIFGLDFSPDGQTIATVGSDKVVRIWDAESLDQRQTMSGHIGPVYAVSFSPTQPLLASVGWNRNIRLWNLETGAEIREIEGGKGDVWGVSFCKDGSGLVTAGQDSIARIWDSASGDAVTSLHGHEGAVHSVDIDSTRHRVATGSRDGTIRVWDLTGLK